MDIKRIISAALLLGVCFSASAAAVVSQVQQPVISVGTSGLWILANISYAGMRAQNSPSRWWRIAAFIFGFPGTLISLIMITEGSERAYGIELPKHRRPDQDK
jgi:hypothetical protein